MYDVPDAPPTILGKKRVVDPKTKKASYVDDPTRVLPNSKATVRHAHRVDDVTKALGCSSKMGDQQLIQHGRLALTDTRPHNATQPAIQYGRIYGHFMKHPEHPSLPGKQASRVPTRPPGMNDPANAQPGNFPPGHPQDGNPPIPIVSQPDSTLHGQAAQQPGANTAAVTGKQQAPLGSRNNKKASSPPRSASRASPSTSTSNNKFPRLPAMTQPYARIPSPDAAAVASARSLYAQVNTKAAPLVQDFEAKYAAWKATWFNGSNSNSPK